MDKSQNIIESQVDYSIDQDQSPEDGSLNAYHTAIESGLSKTEADTVYQTVFDMLDKINK